MIKIQRSDAENTNLIEEGKEIGINEVLSIMKLLITIWNIDMYKYKMKLFCSRCRKDTENINPKVSKTSNGRTMLLSNCAICGSKNSRFIKNQEAKGLLSNLGIRTPLHKVPILGDILFWMQFHWCVRIKWMK